MRIQMEADGSQESGSFPLVNEGDYFIKVLEVRDGVTKRGHNKADIMFGIFDMANPTDALARCWHTITFIPKDKPGHGMWLHANHALGLPYDGSLDFETRDYVDTSCRAHIIIDKYTDKNGNIKTVNRVSEFHTEDSNDKEPSRSASTPKQEPKPTARKDSF